MIKEYDTLEQQLREHEGLWLTPYRCSAGKLTIGVGRNIEDVGITIQEAIVLLNNDISACINDLRDSLFGPTLWSSFSYRRQNALIDLRFNLGPNRFRMFKKMIAAVFEGDWQEAAHQLKDSKWWTQVQADRRDTLYLQLIEG